MKKSLVISEGVVAGNPYDKYGTRNPIARRLMQGFDTSLFELLDLAGPVDSILEVGCGEGHVTQKLAARYPKASVLGTDFSPEIIDLAKQLHPGLAFESQSVYDVSKRTDSWDVIVACEVFEHLDEPARALRELALTARRAIVLTVPREPLWRVLNVLRGEHLARLGNSHGHVQHWSRGGFARFAGAHAEVIAVRSPMPWTQLLCRPRSAA